MPKTRIAIALAPETLEQLARESAKLDHAFEKALAEEGLGAVLAEWPA